MADPEETIAGANQRDDHSPPGMPTWVKALLMGLAVLLVLMVIAHLTGNGPTHMRH